MRRVLLILVAAGNLTVAVAVVPTARPDPTPIVNQQPLQNVVQVSSPPTSQPQVLTQAEDDGRLKRYSTVLATFAIMGAIAIRRTRTRRS
jgi:hypothetical protein